MELITLIASRKDSDVLIHDKEGNHKATFTNRGYRPTKATKAITLNCWKFNLIWA